MVQTLEHLAVELRRCEDFRSLHDTAVSFFFSEGVEMMSYHHMPPVGAPDHSPVISVMTFGFPEEWVSRYTNNNSYTNDPIIRHALSSAFPFWWSEVQEMNDLTRAERAYLDEMNNAGLGNGIGLPLFGPNGREGYGGLGCGLECEKWSDEKVARLHLAGQIFHNNYCRLLRAEAPRDIRLSEREREILKWISKGKSNSVVADILNISPYTVDTHLRRVFVKLGVGDRVTAVLRGVALGLVS